jgi:hypothetical protein
MARSKREWVPLWGEKVPDPFFPQHRFVAPGSDHVPEPDPIDVSPSLPNPLDELISQVAYQPPPQDYAPAPQQRAPRPKRHIEAPNYGGVKFIGRLYEICGYILCVLGCIVILLSLVSLIAGAVATSGHGSAGSAIVGLLGVGGLVGAIYGALLMLLGICEIGAGQLFYCVRDMARNSFYLQRL